MRTIAIGDVHGCSLALAKLLEFLEPHADDEFVFLGDYIDRGPNSYGVIEIILELAKTHKVIALKGNHEVLFEQAFDAGEPNQFWLNQCGGDETMISYGGSVFLIPTAHVQFVRYCQRFYETEKCIFVHANYAPDKPMSEQPDDLIYWRHLTHFIPEPHQSGKIVFVGHTPQRSGNILNLGHVVCIDTGCYAHGWLTALDVNSGQFWQVNKFGERRTPGNNE